MSDEQETSAEGEPRITTFSDLAAFTASLPKCAQCQDKAAGNYHIGFYDPFEEDAVASCGYHRSHLCFKCYLTMLYACFCVEQEPAAE